MLLRNLADLCYNLYSGFLIEAGNGVDDRDLFLEWLGQKAHVLEDTGNILPSGSQLVEQLLEEAPHMEKRRSNGEGNIRKRKDGRWEGRYTAGRDPVTGKQIFKNVLGKTPAEVKEKLQKALAQAGKIDFT